MNEIEYNYETANKQFRVTITGEMRGIGAPRRAITGERIGFNTCRTEHFPNDSPAAPVQAAHDLTGRWEHCWAGGNSGNYLQLTAQINQAGTYVYGWIQIDPVYAAQVQGVDVDLTSDAITASFSGRIDGERNFQMMISVLGSESRFHEANGTIQINSDDEILLTLGREYNTTDQIPIRIHVLKLERSPFAGSAEPRLPNRVLNAMGRQNPLLLLAHAHPLRSDQIRAIRGLVSGTIADRARVCAATANGTLRFAAAENLFHFISQVLSVRRIPLMADGCRCRSSSMENRLERCNCGIPFQPAQLPLVRAFLLRLLEKKTVMVDANYRTLLEIIYNFSEEIGNERDEYTRFRDFRRELGPPELPVHLDHFEYRCTMTFGEASHEIPGLPIKVGGRLFRLTMTRYVKRERQWVLDGDRNTSSASYNGFMALVAIDVSASRGIELPGQGEVVNFKFHTTRLWTWGNFPGYFDIFSASFGLRNPFGQGDQTAESTAIRFVGSGNIPPLIVDQEETTGWNTSLQSSVGAGATLLFGWLFHPGIDDLDDLHATDIMPTSTAEQAVRATHSHCFEFDSPQFLPPTTANSLSDGRSVLGIFLAESLCLFRSPSTRLRVEGFTSRMGSVYHNHVLSIRRSQFVAQTIVDILGSSLATLVARSNQDANGGTFRLFGFGEAQAESSGVADGIDNPLHRRVDLAVNGEVALRLRVGDPTSGAPLE